ncbi:MAG TPA: hypothetical protein VM580_27115 [Labilithrix sp.]|nr:hypothetical protein [Labilithrix sp.]
MSDDPVLDELAKVVREDAARSRELEELARSGEAPAADDEEAAFVRTVLARGSDDALVAAAMRAVGPSKPEATDRTTPTVEGRVVRLSKRGRMVPMVGAVLALAAGLLLFVKVYRREPSLPAYEGVLGGMDATDRATPGSGTKVTRGAGLSLVARPSTPVARRLEARAFGGCGGPLVRLATEVQIAPTGAARVEGTPESLLGAGASGACTLAIVVAPEGELPDRLEDARGDARVVSVALVVNE